jgi:hypothetical protein
VQSFLYSVIADDNELAAKKSLAVLSELWRRHIWRDGRTVNCIGGGDGGVLVCVCFGVKGCMVGCRLLLG